MKTFSLLSLYLALAMSQDTSDAQIDSDFASFVADQGVSYGTQEEFQFRKALYKVKDKKIKKINAAQSNFKLGHNKFSVWTDEEYKAILGVPGLDVTASLLGGVDPSLVTS